MQKYIAILHITFQIEFSYTYASISFTCQGCIYFTILQQFKQQFYILLCFEMQFIPVMVN